MKKILWFFLLAAVTLAGCGSGKTVGISAGDAALALFEKVAVTNDQLVLAPNEVVDEWYSFDENVTEFAIYVSGTSGTANEIAVVKSSDTKTAEAALKKRVEDLKTRFADYVPAEMAKLDSPVIVTKGDAVAMVISDDPNAEKLIGEILK